MPTDQPASPRAVPRAGESSGDDPPGAPLRNRRGQQWHHGSETDGYARPSWRSPPPAPSLRVSSWASAPRRRRHRNPVTSTPPAARRASPRTAPPGRCTPPTTAACTRSGASSDNTTREHQPAGRRRLGQRRRAGLVLRRHDLRHHDHLRPVRAGQPPHPGAPRRVLRPGRGRLRQPRQRHRRAHHAQRPQGVRRLRGPRHRLPQQQHQRRSPRATSRRACTPSSTAPTTTAAAASTTATPRPTAATTATARWRPSTSATSRSGATAAGNGPWIMADLENGLFSGVNQHLNSGDPTHHQPVPDRHHQGRAEPLGHPRRQRPVGQPVHLLQRGAPQRVGLQPDEEGRRHHPRHRRRQQRRRRRAPSTKA